MFGYHQAVQPTRTSRIEQDDVFCVAVPEGIDPADWATLQPQLEALARLWVHRQWQGVPGPAAIKFADSDWLVTDNPDDVDKFQPAHDCVACLAGNDRAKAFLTANPGRWVAMANLHYTEVWLTQPGTQPGTHGHDQ